MKKMFSLALSLCLAVSLSVTAFAEDTTIDEDSPDKNAQTAISANALPTYTVTIPETVKLGETATIKADNVLTESDKTVKVTITGTNQAGNAFLVSTSNGASITYVIKKSNKTEFKINDSISFEEDGSEVLTFEQTAANKVFAGDYSGTVTFTLEYVNK